MLCLCYVSQIYFPAQRIECNTIRTLIIKPSHSFRQRDYARALRELVPSTSYNSENSEALAMLALAQMTQGDLEESIAVYRRVLTKSPGHPEATLNLGHALKESGQFQEAEKILYQYVQ